MFRRRTDQVYATLQQVQRRITEQAGAPGAPGGSTIEATPASGFAPLQEPVVRAPPIQLVARQPEPPPLPSSLGQSRGSAELSVSKSFAVTLIVLWLATDVGFYIFGSYHESRAHPDLSEGYASGKPGMRQVPADADQTNSPTGDFVLVLETVDDASPDNLGRLERRAADLNRIMVANAGNGWKPWFGVRHPENGQLQLVFGERDKDVFGIARASFEDFARIMRQPPPKGAGYADAHWMEVAGQ